jgi:hydrogenase maturation protein HypF
MAENGIDGPVIGLAFDGTGYGEDGAVWGGEVLIAEYRHFRRAAHLAYVPMPGGDAAVREPWRMALAYLDDAYGGDLFRIDLPMMGTLDAARAAAVLAMARKGVNAPPTSSLGRLFDGVAAILDIRRRASFEGQAAMALEAVADPAESGRYDVEWSSDDVRKIRPAPLIRGVVQDRLDGVAPRVISGRFHNTLIHLFTALCLEIRRETGLGHVVMSGGVFQNVILLAGLTRALEKSGFEVSNHARVPANDGGLAIGQAMVAAAAG